VREYVRELDERIVRKYALLPDERLFVCTKPAA